jgi:hypothetical protein
MSLDLVMTDLFTIAQDVFNGMNSIIWLVGGLILGIGLISFVINKFSGIVRG